uniref:LITAF domain-containing protein n=1 Tax=Heterorhabditis bacteriophora TaxID=37862 RepID=A0A1I7WHX5_HETBA
MRSAVSPQANLLEKPFCAQCNIEISKYLLFSAIHNKKNSVNTNYCEKSVLKIFYSNIDGMRKISHQFGFLALVCYDICIIMKFMHFDLQNIYIYIYFF